MLANRQLQKEFNLAKLWYNERRVVYVVYKDGEGRYRISNKCLIKKVYFNSSTLSSILRITLYEIMDFRVEYKTDSILYLHRSKTQAVRTMELLNLKPETTSYLLTTIKPYKQGLNHNYYISYVEC
jgi:hypothetical protein